MGPCPTPSRLQSFDDGFSDIRTVHITQQDHDVVRVDRQVFGRCEPVSRERPCTVSPCQAQSSHETGEHDRVIAATVRGVVGPALVVVHASVFLPRRIDTFSVAQLAQ